MFKSWNPTLRLGSCLVFSPPQIRPLEYATARIGIIKFYVSGNVKLEGQILEAEIIQNVIPTPLQIRTL